MTYSEPEPIKEDGQPARVPPVRRRWLYPLVGFAVASAMTVLFPIQHFLADRYEVFLLRRAGAAPAPVPSWLERQIHELPNWYSWLVLSFAVYALARRFPLTGPRRTAHLALHTAAAFILTFILTIVILMINRPPVPIPGITFTELAILVYSRYVGTFLLLYSAVVAIHHALMYHQAAESRAKHAAELQGRLIESQLDVLKMQIHPHFLFNALNTITSLMLTDVRAAQGMVARLSELLRLSLDGFAHNEVPLHEELRILGHYVAIQQVRFQDRLTVTWDIDVNARDILVPRLVLQPFVENSIRHGIEKVSRHGEIEVHASVSDGRLTMKVRDNGLGPGRQQHTKSAGGVGYRNTQSRLRQLYGPAYTLHLRPLVPHGAEVLIEIPARAAVNEEVTA